MRYAITLFGQAPVHPDGRLTYPSGTRGGLRDE